MSYVRQHGVEGLVMLNLRVVCESVERRTVSEPGVRLLARHINSSSFLC